MKGFVLILLTLACLMILPVGSTYACGSRHSLSKTKVKPVCPKKAYRSASAHQSTYQTAQPKAGTKKKTCDHTCDVSGCRCESSSGCDSSGCNCPHGSSVIALKTTQATPMQKPVVTSSQANSWFFKESALKPVYLSVWMPPKISC